MRLYFVLLSALLSLQAADRTLTSPGAPNTLYFSADGKSIRGLCDDGHVRTWDVTSGKLLAEKSVPRSTALLSADLYVERDMKAKAVRVWDLSAERQLQMINGSPRGYMKASGDRRWIAKSDAKERTVRLVDLATGQERHNLADGLGGAAEIAFSPDGETLVSANYDNDVRVWKTKSGELVKKMEDMTGAMFAAEFTPDGRQLVMAGLDETVYLWDAKSFALNRKLTGQGETIAAMAISPDGKTLVTGGFDVLTTKNPVKVQVWDLASGKIKRTLRAPHCVVSLAFSPDSKWIAVASGEKEIALWGVGN